MRSGDIVARRFEIEQFAGAGAMGLVYRAHDKQTGAAVALKVLAHGSADRFLREARALSTVKHPHIVRYVDHGRTATGEPYLAMEWLEGIDLAQRLTSGPLPLADAVGLVRAVAGALGVAHAQGVVHRDVKPTNLFLLGGDPACVKVLDFGAARFVETTSTRTASGLVLGTPGYLAPEQVHDDTPIDGRADVFALGCVLYECLAARPAFVAQHVLALLGKIMRDHPPPLRGLAAECPQELEDLVGAMLAKDPAARPADMDAVVAALDRLPAPSSDPEPRIEGPVVFRWWNGEAGDHFYTTEASGERALQRGYTYEGVRFRALRAGTPGTLPLYRFYSPSRNEHYYTTDPNDAKAADYESEGILGFVSALPLPETVPLHRWWNASCADHFYTVDPDGELAQPVGYEYEGVVGHVLRASGEVPLRYGRDEGKGEDPRPASPDASPAGPDEGAGAEPSDSAEPAENAGAIEAGRG